MAHEDQWNIENADLDFQPIPCLECEHNLHAPWIKIVLMIMSCQIAVSLQYLELDARLILSTNA